MTKKRNKYDEVNDFRQGVMFCLLPTSVPDWGKKSKSFMAGWSYGSSIKDGMYEACNIHLASMGHEPLEVITLAAKQ